MHYDQDTVKSITPSQYLKEYDTNQVIKPAPSSWGHKGYGEVWLNQGNDWIYPHLHKAAELMINLARNVETHDFLKVRILNQMSRELLLAQSSDWPFIVTMGTFSDFAAKRVVDHLENFYTLYNSFLSDHPKEHIVSTLEGKNNIFPDIHYKVFS